MGATLSGMSVGHYCSEGGNGRLTYQSHAQYTLPVAIHTPPLDT